MFSVTDSKVMQTILCNNASTLKSLRLYELDVTDDEISLNLPTLQLTDLRFSSCGDAFILPVLRKCPRLSSLFHGRRGNTVPFHHMQGTERAPAEGSA